MPQPIDNMEEDFNQMIHGCMRSLKLDMEEVESVLLKLRVKILKCTTAHPSFGTSNVEHQTSSTEATTIPSFQASAPMFTPVSPDARSSSGFLSTGASKTDVPSHHTPPSAAPIRERSSGTLGSASLPLKGIRAPAKLISAASNTPATYSSVFTKNADVCQLSNPDILAAPPFPQHSPPVSKCGENYEGSKQPAVTGATTVPTAPAATCSVGADHTPVSVAIKETAPAEPPSAVTSATRPIKFTIMPAKFIYEYAKQTPITPTSPVASSAWADQSLGSVTKNETAPVEPLSAATKATQPIKVITSPADFSITLDTLAKSTTVTPRNQDVREAFKPCTPAASSHHVKCPSIWKITDDNNEFSEQTPITGVTTAPASSHSAWADQSLGSVTKNEPAPVEPLPDVTSATQPIKVITSPADFSFTLDTLAKSSTVTPNNQDVREAFEPCTPAASSHHGKSPSIWKIRRDNDDCSKQTSITEVTAAPTAPTAVLDSHADQPPVRTKEDPDPSGSSSKTMSSGTNSSSSTVTPSSPMYSIYLENKELYEYYRNKKKKRKKIRGAPTIPATAITGVTTAPVASQSAWADQTLRVGTNKEPAPAVPPSVVISASRPIKLIASPAKFNLNSGASAKSSTVIPHNQDVRQAFKTCTPATSSHHGKWPSIWKIRGHKDKYCKQTPIIGVTTAPVSSRSAWADLRQRVGTNKEPAPAVRPSVVISASRSIKLIASPAKFNVNSGASAKSSAVTPRNQDVRQALKPFTPAASSHHGKWPSIWKIRGNKDKYCKQTSITGMTTAPASSRSAWADLRLRVGTKKEPAPAVRPSVVISASCPIKLIASPAKFNFNSGASAKSTAVTPQNQDVRQAFKTCTPAASHHGKWPSIWKIRRNKDKYCKQTPITGVTTAPTSPVTFSSAWAFQTPRAVTKNKPAAVKPLSAATSATWPIKVITSPADFSFTLDTLAKSSAVTPRNQDVTEAFKPCTPAASSHHWKWPSISTIRDQSDEYAKQTPITGVTTAPTFPVASSSAWADQTPRAVTKNEPAAVEPLPAATPATQPTKVITSPADFSFTLDTLAKSSTVTPRNQDVREAFKPCTPAASSHHWKFPSIWTIGEQSDEYAKQTPITGVTTAPVASSSAWADQTPRAVTKIEPAAAEPLPAATSATQPSKVITSPADFSFTLDTLAKSSTVTPQNQDVREAFKPCTPAASSHHWKFPSIWTIGEQSDEYAKQTPITGVTTAPVASSSAWADQTPRAVTKIEPAAAEPLPAATSATQPSKVITSPADFSFTLDTLAKSSAVTPRNQDVREAFKHCTPAASSHHWKFPSIWTIGEQSDEYAKQTPITGVTTAPVASSSAWADQTPRAVTKIEPAAAEPLPAATSATQPSKVITSPADFSFTLDTLAKSSAVTPRNQDVREAFKPCTPVVSSHHWKFPSIWTIGELSDEYAKQTPITGVTTAPVASSSAWADQTPRAVTKIEPAAAEPLPAATSATQPSKVITSPADFSFTLDTLAKSSAVTPRNQDVREAFKHCTPAASSHHWKFPSIWTIGEQSDEYAKQTPITGVTTAPVASSSAWADQTPRAVTKIEPAAAEPLPAATSATQPSKVITSPADFSFTLDTLAKSSAVTPRNQDVREAFKPCTPVVSSHHWKFPSIWTIGELSDEYAKQTPITGVTTAPVASSSAWADQTPRAVTQIEPAAAEPLPAATSATQPSKVITSPADFSFTLDTLAKSSTVTPRNQDVREAFKPCTPAASSHHWKFPSIWTIGEQSDEYAKQTPITGVTTAPVASSSAWADQTPRAVTKIEPAAAEPLPAATSATQPSKVITSPADFSFTLDTLAKSSAVTPRNQDVREAFKPCTPVVSSHHWKFPSIWTIGEQSDEYAKQTPITGVTTAPVASSSAWADQTPRAVTKIEPAAAEPLPAATSATQPSKVITSPADFSFTLDTLAKSSTVTPRNQDVREAFKPCTPAASSHHWKFPSIWTIGEQSDEYAKQTPITGVTTAPVASSSAWADQTPRAVTKIEPAAAEPLPAATSATQPSKVITSPADFSFTLDTLAKSSTVTPRNQDVREAFKPCTPAASSHHWKWPSIWTIGEQSDEYAKQTPITGVTIAPTFPVASSSAWADQTPRAVTKNEPAAAEPLPATTSAAQSIKAITSPADFSFTLDTFAKSSAVTPNNQDVREAFKPCTPAASSHHGKSPSIGTIRRDNDDCSKQTSITEGTAAPTAPITVLNCHADQPPVRTKEDPDPSGSSSKAMSSGTNASSTVTPSSPMYSIYLENKELYEYYRNKKKKRKKIRGAPTIPATASN